MKKTLLALAIFALPFTSRAETRGVTVNLDGTVAKPTNFWMTNAAGITNAIGSNYAPASHVAATNNPHGVTKAQIGLGSVEDTALSTWAGSTNLAIAAVGTLGTAATSSTSAFASAAQGLLANTALQPGASSTNISGLGGAASLNVGTTSGTVAAGNDSRIVAGGTALQPGAAGTNIGNAPAGNIAATNVQAAINELDTETTAALKLPRVSVMPGLRAWSRRPLTSIRLAVLSDSTGVSPDYWPRLLATSIAAAHPSVSVNVYDWSTSPERMVKTVIQTGASGERYLSAGTGNPTVWMSPTSAQIVTGDIEVVAKVELQDWTPASSKYFLNAGDGVHSAFYFRCETDGVLRFAWSTDNAVATNKAANSTVAVAFADATAHWVKATLDVDNGVGGHEVNFFKSEDGVSWTQLGTTVTGAGTTSIGATWPSTVYCSGSAGLSTGAKYYNADYRAGIGGQIMSAPIDTWPRSNYDAVSVSGSPVIEIWNGSQGGADSAYWTVARCKTVIPFDSQGTIVSLGHNDIYQLSVNHSNTRERLDTLAANIRAASPGCPIVVTLQNPWATTDGRYRLHQELMTSLAQAALASGFPILDVFSFFVDSGFDNSWLVDGVHPTDAKQLLWGAYVYASIFTPAQAP